MTATVYTETLRGGASWSWKLRRGMRLTLTDIEGGANVPLMVFNAHDPIERYNMPDTLKAQHTFFLHQGRTLYSDMGRCLLSLVEDRVGWHDTVSGYSNADDVRARFGERSYQAAHNDWYRNGEDLLLTELGKHDLGRRDVTASLNCFTKIAPGADSSLTFVAGHSPAGGSLTLRADMDVLVVLCAIQHPMDPATDYDPKPVGISLAPGDPAGPDDECRNSSEQSGRAFTLTDQYFL